MYICETVGTGSNMSHENQLCIFTYKLYNSYNCIYFVLHYTIDQIVLILWIFFSILLAIGVTHIHLTYIWHVHMSNEPLAVINFRLKL